MNKSVDEFVKQWIMKANEDLLVVEKLTNPEIIAPFSVGFHCQQAVEKFLKAFLIANKSEPKKTHNIEYLLFECSGFNQEFEKIDPKELSDFGVEARYPGDIYIPEDDEVIEYKRIANDVKSLVEKLISNNC